MKTNRLIIALRGNSGITTGVIMAVVAAAGLSLAGCSKDGGGGRSTVDTTTPAPLQPTGVIKEFYIDDTLIGYERGTFVRWAVTETNTKTVVMLNDTKVGFNGAVTTGPLTANAYYKLSVNSGPSLTKKITVADKLTTELWNSGKRWRTADVWVYKVMIKGSQGQDSLVNDWVSVYNADYARYQDIRTSFYLTGESKEEYLSSYLYGQFPASGRFTTNNSGNMQQEFMWKQRLYIIDSISSTTLVVRFDTTNNYGNTVRNRVRYIPE